jgi:hypothetical protein
MKRILIGAWRLAAGLRTPSRRANLRRLRARGERLESITIREAGAADIPALAALHVTTWNDTYAPFLMKGPGVQVRERQWREKFEKNDAAWFCFVNTSGLAWARASSATWPGGSRASGSIRCGWSGTRGIHHAGYGWRWARTRPTPTRATAITGGAI